MHDRRPSYRVSGSNFKLEVPSGWNIIFNAISRKSYQQLAVIKNSLSPGSTTLLRSKYSKTNEKMTDLESGALSAVINPQPQATKFDVDFYFCEEKVSKRSIPLLQVDKHRSNMLQVIQFNKPSQAPKSIPDYMTLVICVEDSPQQDNVGTPFGDMVLVVNLTYGPEVNLDDEPDNSNPDPPPPPPDTNSGYNYALDRMRPSTIKNYLRYYDTVFLIDDSSPMGQGDPRKWDELRATLTVSVDTAVASGADGIDLCFFNSEAKLRMKDIRGVNAEGKITDVLHEVELSDATPTGLRFGQCLGEYIARLDQAVGTPEYGKIKPLDFIVITHGCPSDDPQTRRELEKAAAHLRAKKHHPNAVGIQFVQIGNDAGVDAAYRALVYCDNGNMVDTVSYTGSLTMDFMTRILLGGIHPNIRALKSPSRNSPKPHLVNFRKLSHIFDRSR